MQIIGENFMEYAKNYENAGFFAQNRVRACICQKKVVILHAIYANR